MKTRRRGLPDGWYPTSEKETRNTLQRWSETEETGGTGVACVIPHAGWYFSGQLAFRTLARLRRDVDTVVVVGGHLPAQNCLLVAPEEGYETPLGILAADLELKKALESCLELIADYDRDNTVEVQLPMVAFLFPEAKVLWLRAPQSSLAAEAGRLLRKVTLELGKKTVVLGSTDLTHYGPSYGYSPRGTGKTALSWVKEENDRGIIEAFLGMKEKEVLKRGIEQRASCSPGAAVTALAYAASCGISRGTLVGYANSADIHPSDSFVGYAGVVYEEGHS
ncbi:MAG: AmmeMemoRadiSam system protein B [Spirochaetales bacterium]|nr:AmmeMemoRadiSam system protein B [Spirochaetales bacterium]